MSLKERYPNVNYNTLGKAGLTVSECGFGGYRVSNKIKENREALTASLLNGINLIDTSSNYMGGQSEKLIGEILNPLTEMKKISRDDIVIVTKGGYIQGKTLEEVEKRKERGNPFPEVVNCSPDLKHCIHPEFLQNQLTASLKRMEQDYTDVYLLHNPEYFLSYTPTKDEEKLKDEYYERIKKSFEYLEEEVKKGRIKYYGISSNTFIECPEKRNFTSLERISEIAAGIKENHFAVVQCPLNILEKGAVKNKNQKENSEPVLQFAKEKNLGVLINRPLNAIEDNKLVRLADYKIKEERTYDEVMDLIKDLIKTEDIIADTFLPELQPDKKKKVTEFLSIGKTLHNNFDKFESANHFTEVKKQQLIPRANYAIAAIYKINPNEQYRANELNQYATFVNITLDSIESLLAKESNQNNKKYHKKLKQYINKDIPLSQKAIKMITSLKEVSSVLVGMRQEEYVKDVLESMTLDEINNFEEYWKL